MSVIISIITRRVALRVSSCSYHLQIRKSYSDRWIKTTQDPANKNTNIPQHKVYPFYFIKPASHIVDFGDDGIGALKDIFSRQKKKFTVSIEGNIGCGKTSLVSYFEKFQTVEAIREPVDQWTDLNGHNALQLLYEDPQRWSFTFNNYAMLTRVEMHKHKTAVPVKMLERSLFSTQYVFVENSLKDGILTKLEHTVLSEWFDYLIESQNINVDLIVYLRAPPEVCYERIRARNRKEESGVPYEFIENLHNLHEEWLIHKKHPIPAPVLVLDASVDFPSMKLTYEERKRDILCGCA